MHITKKDLLAPANFISLIGFGLTIFGSIRLQTMPGFLEVVIGRLLDTLDGPIARRTHSSRFGAILDASLDKLSILSIIIGMSTYQLAPIGIIWYILLQNAFVAAINLLGSYRHIVINTEVTGKRNLFLQITSMLLFAASGLLDGLPALAALWMAYITFVASVIYALLSTRTYLSHHFQSQ